MRALFWVLVCLFLPGLAAASCVGTDLLETMPADTRAMLNARAQAHPYPEGNIWRATRNGQTLDLIGTYHLPDPRHAPTLAHARTLMQSAKAVLVEAGPDEMASLKSEVARRPEFMFILDGPTLPDLLSPTDWAAVSAAAQARGVPGFMVAKMRPWYLATLLTLPACAFDALKNPDTRGLDQDIILAAGQAGLGVSALEPFDTLFQVFSSLTPDQELDMVRGFLAMESHPEDLMTTLANAYFRGQSRLLWEFTIYDSLSAPGFDPAEVRALFTTMEDILMTRRNRGWIPVLEKSAAEHGHVLAAFGALHLPGDTGVLNLLAANGWAITRADP